MAKHGLVWDVCCCLWPREGSHSQGQLSYLSTLGGHQRDHVLELCGWPTCASLPSIPL